MMRTAASRVVVTGTALLALAGCGGGTSAAPTGEAAPPGPTFTQADVDFAVEVSQHHGQALRMTDLAATRARSPQVKALAKQIGRDYARDIDVIAEWIRLWGAAGAELPAHDAGFGETGAGMLPEAAVDRLERLKGAAFDSKFRQLMARHHRGGLDLAKDELDGGINPDARAMAERLQLTQIRQLNTLAVRS
ncbi:MAG: DUF305 domain-containing protein [Sporichthyaceae bacterium]